MHNKFYFYHRAVVMVMVVVVRLATDEVHRGNTPCQVLLKRVTSRYDAE